ncbi:aminoglycoside phosphotransferase family protein [Saccharibacillus sacchari]|uniref:Aminoglycoside phosphotransferase family protein n=1 Tax=Saccharibacillus sacchari TaxID=456493 RepID=A0ACC6P6B8_9BACL
MNDLNKANKIISSQDGVSGHVPELLGRDIAPLGEIIEAYPIQAGVSADRKYKVHFYGYDGAYLLRLFEESALAFKRSEFEALHRMQAMTVHCSRPIAMGRWETEGTYFLLVSYIDGTDAQHILPISPKPQQLRVGMQAGEELSRISCYPAPEGMESWTDRYVRRTERELDVLKSKGITSRGIEAVTVKVRSSASLTEARPSVFLHGSFEPANLIVHQGRLAGVVGFGGFDWGDPLYEFSRLGLYSRGVSTLFCTGQILGYHGGQEPDSEFWELYALYAASGAVSLVAKTVGNKSSELNTVIERVDRLAEDHEDFANVRPSWFAAL